MQKLFKATLLSLALVGTYAYAEPSYLEATYGISAEEAQLRLDLQEQVIALSEKLNAENDPNYADMYIQHTPVYKIVILFSDNKNRHQFLKSLDPKLQRYVQLKNVKKSRSQYEQELETLGKLISSLNIKYNAKFDLEKQRYEVVIESKDSLNIIKQATKKLSFKNDVHLEVGSLFKVQSAPTGVQKGDRIFGGNKLSVQPNDTKDHDCTVGYAVNYKIGNTTKQGILTAGHCGSPLYFNISGRDVVFDNPIVQKRERDTKDGGDGVSDKYDYQVFDATGLNLTNEIKYDNSINRIPEFSKPTGSFRVTKTLGFMNQKKGMIVCKSGATTGLTCGEIVNGNLEHDGAKGWIEVAKTKQFNLSQGGDSGGPWFLYPGKSTTITALGIHTAGRDNPDDAAYMPIDYIDDHNTSITLILK